MEPEGSLPQSQVPADSRQGVVLQLGGLGEVLTPHRTNLRSTSQGLGLVLTLRYSTGSGQWTWNSAWEINGSSRSKGKAVPLQLRRGPEGSRKLRFPDFVSPLRTGRLYPPGNTPGTHFCQLLSRPQDHIAIGRILCQCKIPVTPPGIEPPTFPFVAQHLNHCATAVPGLQEVGWGNIDWYGLGEGQAAGSCVSSNN